MNLLLDTHAFLWFISGDARLSKDARLSIENEGNQIFVSAGTLWEIAIKTSLGRLKFSGGFKDLISDQLRLNGFNILPITPSHLDIVVALPFLHRDPFDRLLIAQAKAESWAIISADVVLDSYEVTRLW